MDAGNWIVLLSSAFVCLVAIGIAVYDTWDRHKIKQATQRDALRLAALRAQFDQDHPDRVRLGMNKEEK